MPVGHVSRYTIIEFAEDDFDDRTLSSLVNSANGGRPELNTLLNDGVHDDNPYLALPLLRPSMASVERRNNKWND